MDYAESLDEEKDSKLIQLIALALPPISPMMYMISSMKTDNYRQISENDPEYIKARKEADQTLIMRLKHYINDNSLLARCLKDENFFSNNIEYLKNPDSKIIEHVEGKNVFKKTRTFREYNPKEPIYIRLESGRITTIDTIKGFPLSSKTIENTYVYQIKFLGEPCNLLSQQAIDTVPSVLPIGKYPDNYYIVEDTFLTTSDIESDNNR